METLNNQIINVDINPLVSLSQFKTQIIELGEKCKNIIIIDNDSLGMAENLAKDAKKIAKTIDDKRLEITNPILKKKTEIDNFAKSLVAELETGTKIIREQILNYKKEQERIRQEELRRIEEERRKAEAERLKIEAENRRIEEENRKRLELDKNAVIEEIKPITPEPEPIKIATPPPPKGLTKFWNFEVVNLDLIPREYFILDEKAIRAAINAGTREIDGLKIFQDERLTLR